MKIEISRSMRALGLVLATAGLAPAAMAAAVMPSFDNAPTGWAVDRYAPASFSDIGVYQGRDNVLAIGIDSSTDSNQRGAQSGTFYNTQGMKYLISGGAGSVLAADLYIEGSWRSNTNGFVRTDMWGTMADGAAVVTAYPIIGFTNYGGAARLRVWDADTANGWVDLADAVLYDAWNSFSIEFTGSSFDYYVNGAFAYSYTDTTISGTTQFKEVIMQAYNFNDPSLNISNNAAYTAHWANAQASVPEPGSLALAALALISLGAAGRRRAQRTQV